ncbi:hypothetical protein ACROYT_G043242 [Oculina patagonica]
MKAGPLRRRYPITGQNGNRIFNLLRFEPVKGQTLKGNSDRDSEVKHILYEGVLARYLRFLPETHHGGVCMRIDVYGVKQKPENLALGKPTAQSSTYNSNPSVGADVSGRAVDGNPDTEMTNGHCSNTQQNNPSWWRVDLGSDHVPVSEIYIVNRFSASSIIQQRSEDYKITLGSSLTVANNPTCKGLYSFIQFKASAVCFTNPLKTGRYVGIMTTKKQFLQLCEVEIYSRENLAFGKQTSQISTDHGGVSSRAVDGNSDTNIYSGSCTHTRWANQPWWRVDLGQVEPVSEVYIVNRGDGLWSFRLSNFEIRVGSTTSGGGLTNPKCGGNYSIPGGKGLSFFCRPPLHGRYVTIRSLLSNLLTICEMEVYSERKACQMQALGVTSSDAFPDDSFSASSSRSGNEAFKGRLNGVGSWSPNSNNDANDYLQINLKYEFFICAVATQGKSNADHWTTKYKLLLSLNNVDWVTYQENSIDKVFNGNSGKNDIVKHNLKEITRARFIRFQPITYSTRKALRVEVFGILKPAAPSQAPSSFAVFPLSSTSVKATWQLPPMGSRHGIITGFKLLYRRKSSAADSLTILTIENNNSTLTIDVTGLRKYTEYEFQVLAFSYAGNGPTSSVQLVITHQDVPSKPPSKVTVTVRSSTRITVSWQVPPKYFRHGIITGFKLFYKITGSAESPNMLPINSGAIRTRDVTGLKKYTGYEFQLLAFTSDGDGPKSPVVVVRTMEDGSCKPVTRELPERTILVVGELAILTCEIRCEISGYPEPSVTWSKDGDTKIPRAQFSNNRRVLAIKDVLPLDSGVYQCKASSKLGESRTSTTLIIAGMLFWLQHGLISIEFQVIDENLVPPIINEDISPPSVICEKQTLCLLSCYASSDSPCHYSWTKNGQFPQGDDIKIMNNSLVLTPRDVTDYGVYVCHASNSFGSTAYKITLSEGHKSSTTAHTVKEDNSECH